MVLTDEELFPRSIERKQQSSRKKCKRKLSNNLFTTEGAATSRKRQKTRQVADSEMTNADDIFFSKLELRGTLTNEKIHEGQIVLGCVKQVQNLHLQLELPGPTFARVSIQCISKPFIQIVTEQAAANELNDPLASIFKVGQCVPVKIMNIHLRDKKCVVNGTINPIDINKNMNGSSLTRGLLIWACILSKLDHGYELGTGIDNCKAFLPFENVQPSKKYVVGESIYCTIQKCQHSDSVTILTVSTKQDSKNKQTLEDVSNVYSLVPGTCVKFCVSQKTKCGLKGYFMNSFYGYIDDSQLLCSNNTVKDFTGSETLDAYILYTEQLTNVTYLTLRNPNVINEKEFVVGTIHKATVSSISSKGIYWNIASCKAFVSNRRLLNSISNKKQATETDIKSKYRLGSTHTCRILDYNPFQEVYICTTETMIFNQVLSSDDVQIAQKLTVTIIGIKSNGLVVKVDSLQGFVPNIHLSDVLYTDNIKRKLKNGSKHRARVFEITETNNVIFTLKKSLVQSDRSVITRDGRIIGNCYDGVVVKITSSGALIAFYRGITGWLPTENISLTIGQCDPNVYFYLGQGIEVYVSKHNDFKIELSLIPPRDLIQVHDLNSIQDGRNVTPTNGQHEDFEAILDLLQSYIKDYDHILKCGYIKNSELAKYSVGKNVNGVVDSVNEDKKCLIKLTDGVQGIVPNNLYFGNLKLGEHVDGVVIFHDIVNNQVFISLKPNINALINTEQNGCIEKSLPASGYVENLLYTEHFLIVLLRGPKFNGQLMYLPAHCSKNDTEYIDYDTNGHKFKTFVCRMVEKKIIGLGKIFVKSMKRKHVREKKRLLKKNRKNGNGAEKQGRQEILSKKTHIKKTNKPKCENVINENPDNAENNKVVVFLEDVQLPYFSDMSSFYSFDDKLNNEILSDEELEDTSEKKKRKGMTPSQRADIARQEENRISTIEKQLLEYMDCPQIAEHFERLLMADSNNSQLWLKYIAMHMASADLDKARAVASRALEAINIVNSKDKFNLLLALLNIENMYGTKKSFEKVFENALQQSDPLDVQLAAINMLADSGKCSEMEEKIKRVRHKEKQSLKMWLEVGKVYFRLNMLQEARKFKAYALKSLTDKKQQFDLIVGFGIMEFRFGELKQAVLNFETILQIFPSKLNIWSIYVDQLVKADQIQSARNVMKRATSQKLSPKSMKSLFHKFRAFEEKYGNADTIAEVEQKTLLFVDNISKT